MRSKILLVLACLASLVLVPATSASATDATACVGVWSWNFSPALALPHVQGFGTVTVTTTFPNNTCAIAATPCPGQIACTATPIGWSGTFTASYAGNCLSATVWMGSGDPAFVLGGAAVVYPGSDFTLVGALANLCTLNPADGPVVWADVNP